MLSSTAGRRKRSALRRQTGLLSRLAPFRIRSSHALQTQLTFVPVCVAKSYFTSPVLLQARAVRAEALRRLDDSCGPAAGEWVHKHVLQGTTPAFNHLAASC